MQDFVGGANVQYGDFSEKNVCHYKRAGTRRRGRAHLPILRDIAVPSISGDSPMMHRGGGDSHMVPYAS